MDNNSKMINYRKLLYEYARPVEVWDKSNADNERRLRFLKYEAVGNSQHKFTEELTNKAHRMNRKLDLQLENEVSRLAKTHGTNCYEIQRKKERIQHEENETLKTKMTSSKYERLLRGKTPWMTEGRQESFSMGQNNNLTSRASFVRHNDTQSRSQSERTHIKSNKSKRGHLSRHESTLSIMNRNNSLYDVIEFDNIGPNGTSLSQSRAVSLSPTDMHISHNKSATKSLPNLSRSRKRLPSHPRCTTVNPTNKRAGNESVREKTKLHRYYVRSTYSFSSREASVATPGNKLGGVDLIQLAPNAKYSDGISIASTKYN